MTISAYVAQSNVFQARIAELGLTSDSGSPLHENNHDDRLLGAFSNYVGMKILKKQGIEIGYHDDSLSGMGNAYHALTEDPKLNISVLRAKQYREQDVKALQALADDFPIPAPAGTVTPPRAASDLRMQPVAKSKQP